MAYFYGGYGGWAPYVSASERRLNAAREVARLRKQGRNICPVEIVGSKIASTWWGKAWCKNLERYSDYASRLPRGRSYVRNGAVLDLQIEPGRIRALVLGTETYEVDIRIGPIAPQRWQKIVEACSGQVGSLVELLRGELSRSVLDVLTRKESGLFPEPKEIALECSCPDWATLCKHVAAVLYGVGARLDTDPELFFRLRKVDQMDLIGGAAAAAAPRRNTLQSKDLGAVFGIEIEQTAANPVPADPARKAAAEPARAPRTRKVRGKPAGLSELIRAEVARALAGRRGVRAAKQVRRRRRTRRKKS